MDEIFKCEFIEQSDEQKATAIETLLEQIRAVQSKDVVGLCIAVKQKDLTQSFVGFAGEIEQILHAVEVMMTSLDKQMDKIERLKTAH